MWQAISGRRCQWPAMTATRPRCNIIIRAIVINMSDSNETTSLSTSSSAVIVGDIVGCAGVGVAAVPDVTAAVGVVASPVNIIDVIDVDVRRIKHAAAIDRVINI